jgi:S-DNA-T family DNA segregation ATPase FtsK/SpoIIIE
LVVPLAFFILGWVLFAGIHKWATRYQIAGIILFFLVVVSVCQLARTSNLHALYASWTIGDPDAFVQGVKHGGGWIGFVFTYLLESAFGATVPGRLCSLITLSAIAMISVLLVTKIPATEMASYILAGILSVPRAINSLKRQRKPRSTSPAVKRLERKREDGKTLIGALAEKLHREVPPTVTPVAIKPHVTIRSGGNGNGDGHKTIEPIVRPAPRSDTDFQLPPITLLKEPDPPAKRAQAELNYKIDKIEQTLEEFKIEADVVEVAHGPTVTRYEVQLAPGIKVSKIVSLADNLAMALAAIDVRVEAPIPGKSAIGVEVPNDNRALVTLREVIDTPEFYNAESKLTVALGKDVAGVCKYTDLTKMPHMLIAGSTNSGKSICLNTLIISLLYRATPREVKLILIDPKRVELSIFDGIPHLCTPVIRDTRQAAGILRTVLKEMDRRYDRFVVERTKNFDGFNSKVKPEDRLPYIVVVIDELADLMMQAGPEIEFSICRLAQLARATGIHLVIATQRPSVDVVTGLIKANISSRIAFAVTSQIDSRTILDTGGAERLIGKGDMLFKPIDAGKPTRIQGPYVGEKEIDSLVQYLKDQETPEYSMEPSAIGEGSGSEPGSGGNSDGANDELYEPAVRLVLNTGYASTSMIQRRFKVGYTRAARLVDTMEEQGIVGPPDGSRPREILISKMDLDRIFGAPLFAEEELSEEVQEVGEDE